MLKALRLHNFRTFLNTTVSFGQRHLIIGRNNSGKTNLCAALRFLRRSASDDLITASQEIPGGLGEICNWATKTGEVSLGVTCSLPVSGTPHEYEYDLQLQVDRTATTAQAGRPLVRLVRETLNVSSSDFTGILLDNDGHEALLLHEGSSEGYKAKTLAPTDATMLSKLYELDTNPRATAFRSYLQGWLYYSLSPYLLRYGWREATPSSGAILPHGEDLAFYLFRLKNIDEARYRRVLEHVRIIEPSLEAVNFLPVPDQGAVPFVSMRDSPRASWHGLSDGTLRALALASIAETVGGDVAQNSALVPLVAIEEPENGIFPGLLRTFFDRFEDRSPNGQFLFTSHSPYFINLFDNARQSVSHLVRKNERTVITSPPPPDDKNPDRELLAEQLALDLLI